MGTFTALDDADLAQLGDAFALGAVRACRPIAAGTINSNFDITTERGRFFLRINEGKSEDDVAYESQLVAAFAAGGVVTPPPMRARDGRPYLAHRGKFVSVFAWRDGVHLEASEVTTEYAHAFGAALGQLHRVGLEQPASWRRASIYDHDHLVARFERFAHSDDAQLARAIAILREELAAAAAARDVRAAATHGIIHGDLFRDNVLWQSDRITAILDFEQASGGSLAYDLAVCINDWCWTHEPRPELAHALVAGYEHVRPLATGDRAALPIELRAAAARFTITRITDVYLAKIAKPEKDFRAFLARSEAWRGEALGVVTSAL